MTMARPTLLNDKLKDQLEAAAEAVYHYKYIAGLCGITPQTLAEYREKDPDLLMRLNQARSKFIRNHMRKAKPDFMLQTADREIFGQKAELSITGGESPIGLLLKAYDIDPKKLSEVEKDAGQDDGAIQEAPSSQT